MMRPILRSWSDACLEDLAARAAERFVARGRDYLAHGHVQARLVAGDRLAGAVLGSSGWYTTTAALVEGEIVSSCTCPFQGALCKHAAALILAWLAEPASFCDLDGEGRLPEADPTELRRLCKDLCLAAPRAAIALLASRVPEAGTAAAVSLARNLLAWPRTAMRNQEELVERLDWVAGKLLPAVSAGDAEAIEAALDLTERLLAVWREAPRGPGLSDLVSRYCRRLALSWPAGVSPPVDPGRLYALFQPEGMPFAGELCLLLAAAGGPKLEETIVALPCWAREVLDLLWEGAGHLREVSFESLLLLLDAYERWDRCQEAIALARAALRRPDEAERYVLRARLARLHEGAGERRQSLAYLTVNFRARPDLAGWEAMRRTARIAKEWDRVRIEVWPVVKGAPLAVQVRAAVDESDPDLLDELACRIQDTDGQAVLVWSALAEHQPERALSLLLQGARAALAGGGRAARRRAREFIRAAGRVCRSRGWNERWAEDLSSLRSEFPAAAAWPELGALLAPDAAEFT